jgi:hypothetical protein
VSTLLSQLPAFFNTSTSPPLSLPPAGDDLYRSLVVDLSRLRCAMYGIPAEYIDEGEMLRLAADRQSCQPRVCRQLAGLALLELRCSTKQIGFLAVLWIRIWWIPNKLASWIRIRCILVRSWFPGSVPLTKGSGCGSCYFRQ